MTPDLIYCREDEDVERSTGKMQDGELSAKTLGKVSHAPLEE